MKRPALARAAAAPLPLLALVTLALLTTACATPRQPTATAATTPAATPTVTAAALQTPASSTEPPAPEADAATSAPPAAPPAALPRHWSGRLALLIETDPPQHWSARFELSGDPSAGELLLSSPLGQALARAHWQPGLVQLEHQGRRYAFADMDALSAQLLGVAVPLPPLFAWLQGQPQALDGWQVDVSQHAQGRILARRWQPLPSAELRLLLLPPQAAAARPAQPPSATPASPDSQATAPDAPAPP